MLNYDDMLEQALYRFTNGDVHFESLDDYVSTAYPAKVIKLHGSINWFKLIGPQNTEWKTSVRNNDVLFKSPDDAIHVATTNGRSDNKPTYQIEISGQRVYPILTAPLAGKGATAMVCPEKHLATAREFLNDCSRFLIIGASGLDDDLLELLRESVRTRSPRVRFVSGSKAQGIEIWRRFESKVGPFRSVIGEVAFDGGFRDYVKSDAAANFLRA